MVYLVIYLLHLPCFSETHQVPSLLSLLGIASFQLNPLGDQLKPMKTDICKRKIELSTSLTIM